MFYFHGTPSGAVESVAFKPFAHPRNIRVIGPNRPGFGQSDPQPGRTISDHALDVMAIADSLGYDKFSVMGASGGGPYSLACAKVIPKERLSGVGVVAGVCPLYLGTKGMDWQGWLRFQAVNFLGPMLGPVMRREYDKRLKGRSYEELARLFKKDLSMIGRSLGENDQAALAQEEVVKEIIDSFIEAYERSAEGAIIDSQLIVGNWDFNIEDIQYEGIKLYWGIEDKGTPVYPARKMHKLLKNAEMMEFENEGHWSIFLNRGDDIFDDFMKDGKEGSG
ncbi:hypothetical protein ABW20_dc0100157 [Dactylellina cionopaga]|nr:hypothetical protein ABW20_dc0100157 [Dactylellina cionopaga]